MEGGWFLMPRVLMEHPAAAPKQPFTDFEACCWMRHEAAFKPRKVDLGGRTVTIERGQMAHSIRFMAKAWGWTDSKVRRFLSRLRRDGLIELKTDPAGTITSICDYDVNRIAAPQTDAAAPHQRRIRRKREDKEERGKRKNPE